MTLLVLSRQAEALDLTVGVRVGGVSVGSVPSFAVSPHVTFTKPLGEALFVAVNATVSILPDPYEGVGFFSPAAALLGYRWGDRQLAVGPSLALFHMTACGPLYCSRTWGAAPGAHLQAEVFFLGPLGASISIDASWFVGNNAVLSGTVAGMLLAGPVIRIGNTEGK